MKYHVSTSKRTKNDGVNLQKKLEELKKLLKERDEELEKLNEELEEAKEAKNEEMEQLRNKLKRKDEELRMLRKKKDKDHEANVKRIEELVKLKDEMEDANEELQKIIKLKNEEMEEAKEAKDEEMEQLRNKLKMKDEELRMLRKKKDKDHEANVKRIEELMKLKDEMKDANEELQKIIKMHETNGNVDINAVTRIEELEKQRKEEMQKANEELQKLRKEKDEELQKMIRDKDDQLQKLVKKKDDEKKDEIARVKKEVEQYSKSSCSWTMSPSVKYLPASSEGERVHLTRRRPVPPETFAYYEQSYDFVSSNMPRIEACLNVFNKAQFVDEENTGWPSPSSFNVLIGKNNRGFDKHNWWFAKANHPEGGLTMLAYYDGTYSKFSSGPDRTIQLPFLKDATLAPYKPFFFLDVHSFGVKLAFMYRIWPHHGVELPTTSMWSRSELEYHLSDVKWTKIDGADELKRLVKEIDDKVEDANEELEKMIKLYETNGYIGIKAARRMEELEKERDEEIQKANEEMRKLRKEKDEELQKMIRDKDDQLQKLGKKKDDEKKDEIARVMKEVEQCSKSSCSWTMSPSVRYLPMDSEGTRVHLTRRRPVPPETFIYGEDPHDFVSCNMPRIEACLNVFNSAQFVDEQNTGWPIPSSFKVLIGKNNRGFDKHNWWFAKANHPEGGLTMLAYYDGNYSKFSSGPDRTIQLPFLKDATLAPFKPFFLLKVHSFGVKLVFMYRV
ncbi:Laminin subunit alpha-2 [Linum perenne]